MRDLLIKVNRITSKDAMCIEVLTASGEELDDMDADVLQLFNDMFFDTCSEDMLEYYENECGLKPLASQSLADRRSAVIARWCSENRCSLEMMQDVADAWNNGKTNITYNGSLITVNFIDKGIPTGLEQLKSALNEVRPAHIPISYVFIYTAWADLLTQTWSEVSTETWESIRTR